MKKIALYFTGFAFSALMFSCSTSNVTRFSGSDLEVVSSQPTMKQAATTDNVAVVEETSEVALKDIKAETDNIVSDNKELPNQDLSKITVEQATEMYNKELKKMVATTNNKVAKMTLERASSQLDKMYVNKEKLSFIDRLSQKFYSKIVSRQLAKGAAGMSTADIFAIVSFATGTLSLLTSFASWRGYFGLGGAIPLGVAGIVFGIISRKKGVSDKFKWMPLLGIIFGALGIFFAITFTIFWIIWIF